jgi:hypothetical protein
MRKGKEHLRNLDIFAYETDPDDDDMSMESIYQFTFIFLIEPTSSFYSKSYHFFLSLCVLLHVVIKILESMDGPNRYSHNQEHISTYPYLGTQQVSLSPSILILITMR